MQNSASSHGKVPRTYGDLPVYRLVDVLKHVPLPPNCPLAGVSNKWRCVLSPKVTEGQGEDEETLRFFDLGIPCRLPRYRATPAHTACGDDAFAYITDTRWNEFPRPKIAFKAGWAGPGTMMESEAFHKLIKSFKEVTEHCEEARMPGDASAVDSTEGTDAVGPTRAADDVVPQEILNLQMFHRSDPNVDPLIPVLAEKLVWPELLEEGAVCDNATRVSQRGAVTWWHLDDSGEFVMQTALPLRKTARSFVQAPELAPHATALEKEIYTTLYCSDESSASIPTKLFIYGPPNSYDWFMHDDEADTTGKIAALDIFRCPDECLPLDESLLPVLTVAVLESSGRPLVSPPNIPHAVISVNDCVMVEQRRIANLFLEEVAYFLQKCKQWHDSPIVYQYVSEQLKNETVVRDDVIPTLIALFDQHDDHNDRHHVLVRQRVAASLFTILSFPDMFALSDDPRASLRSLLSEKMGRYLDAVLSSEPITKWTLRQRLVDHWAVKTPFWPKPGCVFAPPRNIGSSHSTNPIPGVFLPVVYQRGIPVYGCEKSTVGATLPEYQHMAKLVSASEEHDETANKLRKYLRTVKKSVTDDLLDELF